MKKLFLLLALLGMVATGCSKDEVDKGNDNDNKIYYTTSDNTKLFPKTDASLYGAILISNTYKDGQGVLVFDDAVTTIGEWAFEDCESLTSVTIPNSVTTIGDYAFYGCSSLTSVTIGDSVTTIGYQAFDGCSSLQEFRGKFASEDGRCLIIDGVLNYFAPAGLTEYTIPDSVTSIESSAFSGCSSLTSVTIPDSVTTIGRFAFDDCSSLTSVTIPDSVTTIGDSAFSGCSSLTSVTIPDSVTTIGSFAFCNCIGELIINSKIIETDYAYNNYPSYDGWLRGAKFTKLTIGDSVTTIGDCAFGKCSSLTSVTIPDSVTTIGIQAFSGCSSLTSVYCKAVTPPAGDYDMFYDNAYGRKIYVPTESVEAYKSAEYWSAYKSSIVGYDF